MRRIAHCGLLALVLGLVATADRTALAQSPGKKGGKLLDRITITPSALSFEIDYDGSEHAGHGNRFEARAVFRNYAQDGSYTEETTNINEEATWTSSNVSVYEVVAYDGDTGNLDESGLWVFWYFNPTNTAGSTTITITYGGKTASASLTATDSRPPE